MPYYQHTKNVTEILIELIPLCYIPDAVGVLVLGAVANTAACQIFVSVCICSYTASISNKLICYLLWFTLEQKENFSQQESKKSNCIGPEKQNHNFGLKTVASHHILHFLHHATFMIFYY